MNHGYLSISQKLRNGEKKGESPPKKPKLKPFAKKIMITVFWDHEGVISIDFHSQGTHINSESYGTTLKKLKEDISEKRSGKKVKLLHDNARPHTAKTVKELISSFGWEILEHPPYSPDLSPSDYYLFAPLKNYLRGITHPNEEELKFATSSWLEKQPSEFYRKGIWKLPERWQKCIEAEGEYFEKK